MLKLILENMGEYVSEQRALSYKYMYIHIFVYKYIKTLKLLLGQ